MNREICWNLINAGLAGGLVLLGSLADGEFSLKGLGFAVIAGLIVAVTKFKEYWEKEEAEYSNKPFSFISF